MSQRPFVWVVSDACEGMLTEPRWNHVIPSFYLFGVTPDVPPPDQQKDTSCPQLGSSNDCPLIFGQSSLIWDSRLHPGLSFPADPHWEPVLGA